MSKKPHLSKAEIWNMSVGFLGIQMGFALQNGNASRILQTLGADIHELSWFWLVAPITGMIVQPIMSDKTWTKLGRRKPFFLTGALLASVGLLLMPNASMFAAFLPALWVGAGMLMIMDASFNVAMEPFRALVADKLPSEQRTEGYSAQTTLIGIGAVIGSWLPYVLTNWVGIKSDNAPNEVPLSLIISFIIGALVLVLCILWTLKTTREYSPQEMLEHEDAEKNSSTNVSNDAESNGGFINDIVKNIGNMPETMRQLAWVQFFSWFALFGMWVYTTPAIANHVFGLSIEDHSSKAYNDAGDWVGIIFGIYNLVSALYAFYGLPQLAKKYGRTKAHMISLVLGGLGLISIYFAPNKEFLILSMIGVGFAWASILAMPYAILAGSIPPKKMGVYMGIFNLFITIPQIISGIVGGPLVKYVYHDKAIYAIVVSGCCMLLAAAATALVKDVDDVK
jgi:maltose/moltooligosaccharide transporter